MHYVIVDQICEINFSLMKQTFTYFNNHHCLQLWCATNVVEIDLLCFSQVSLASQAQLADSQEITYCMWCTVTHTFLKPIIAGSVIQFMWTSCCLFATNLTSYKIWPSFYWPWKQTIFFLCIDAQVKLQKVYYIMRVFCGVNRIDSESNENVCM